MPQIKERGVGKQDKTTKWEAEYSAADGQVTIWYKGDKEQENSFGKIVAALQLARQLVDKALDSLKKEKDSPSPYLKEVLNYHFGGRNQEAKPSEDTKKGEVPRQHFNAIVGGFERIQEGLARQVILCLSKNLGSDRGETSREMHLNLALLKDDDDMAIARTIIHEASHKFAHTHGTKYGGKTELYAINKQYKKQIPKDAKECADSYAWAAISLWHTHLLTADNFSNGLGCSPCFEATLE
jgi:hypothetical protein